jgi:hypothetical protein
MYSKTKIVLDQLPIRPFSKRHIAENNSELPIDVHPSVLCTRTVKRIFRIAWVSAANGGVAWVMFTRLRSVGLLSGKLNFQLCFEFVFEVILPLIGIVLEIASWKFARWVNVGCFICSGVFWLAAAVWWRSDSFFGVLLIFAVGLLTIAGITEVVYRGTRNNPTDTT